MKLLFLIAILLGFTVLAKAQNNKNILPQLFEEGVISTGDYESHPAFSPTGDTLYFIKLSTDLKLSAICVSYHNNGSWTKPQVASFSGQYMDADPFVAKDGKEIYFMSNRPDKAGDPPKDDTDIFMVKLTGNSWGKPIRLGAPVNSEADEYYPTIADNGTIYFGSPRKGGKGGSDIYRCRLVDGKYQPAENLGDAINTENNEYEAFIAPDESYLIFMATVPRGLGNADYYISYNKNGVFTKAVKLPEPLNSDGTEWSPKVTRDKKWFYFSSTRNRLTATPTKPLTIDEYNKKLRSAGNSLGDIYVIDFSVIENLAKP